MIRPHERGPPTILEQIINTRKNEMIILGETIRRYLDDGTVVDVRSFVTDPNSQFGFLIAEINQFPQTMRIETAIPIVGSLACDDVEEYYNLGAMVRNSSEAAQIIANTLDLVDITYLPMDL